MMKGTLLQLRTQVPKTCFSSPLKPSGCPLCVPDDEESSGQELTASAATETAAAHPPEQPALCLRGLRALTDSHSLHTLRPIHGQLFPSQAAATRHFYLVVTPRQQQSEKRNRAAGSYHSAGLSNNDTQKIYSHFSQSLPIAVRRKRIKKTYITRGRKGKAAAVRRRTQATPVLRAHPPGTEFPRTASGQRHPPAERKPALSAAPRSPRSQSPIPALGSARRALGKRHEPRALRAGERAGSYARGPERRRTGSNGRPTPPPRCVGLRPRRYSPTPACLRQKMRSGWCFAMAPSTLLGALPPCPGPGRGVESV